MNCLFDRPYCLLLLLLLLQAQRDFVGLHTCCAPSAACPTQCTAFELPVLLLVAAAAGPARLLRFPHLLRTKHCAFHAVDIFWAA
jgi:hypothetical protein